MVTVHNKNIVPFGADLCSLAQLGTASYWLHGILISSNGIHNLQEPNVTVLGCTT